MLRQLMLSKKIKGLRDSLNALLEDERKLATREAELAEAVEQAETEEEVAAIEESVTEIEEEKAAIAEKKSKLESDIAELEGELEELNQKAPKNDDPPKDEGRSKQQGGEFEMRTGRYFAGLTRESMERLVAREEVRELIARTRELGNQRRGVSGADLLIPDVMLGLLRDNLSETSKLLSKVNYKPLKGTARQNITGTVPEAVWTEMVGALNELDFRIKLVEEDGYKVAGFL